jgi:hypothetical protein
LAPASSSTAGRSRVGIVVASAGRSTPGIIPKAACAAITVAPVWPALNSAAASPPATRAQATRIDARGLRRSVDGASAISITSGASTISSPRSRQSSCAASASSRAAVRPTSAIWTSRWRAAATAPSTMAPGA